MTRLPKLASAVILLAPVLVVLATARPAAALYMEIDLEEVPIDRLVTNMERRAAQNPQDADAQHQLARIHAMAYTSKRDSLIVIPASKDLWSQHTHVPFLAQCHKGPGVLMAPEPQIVPNGGGAPAPQPAPKPQDEGRWRGSHRGGEPKVQSTDDLKKQAAFKEHLQKAIAHYKKALELAPDNLTAALGHAWALEQSGDKEGAVAGYRRVVQLGWEQEQKLLPKELPGGLIDGGGGVGPDWQSITSEAGGYLLPHLDAAKDAAEIATIKERVARLTQVNRAVTPLMIPLVVGSKVEELVDPAAHVCFDADGSGVRQTWSWITPKAGWLVIDRRGSGRIHSALQMFGNVSYWCFWRDGYQALAALDDNGNGELAGDELRDLAVWCDANTNGVSDPGEVRPLAAWRIVALSCRGTDASRDARSTYCAWSPDGVRFQNGSVRPTFDVLLHKATGK